MRIFTTVLAMLFCATSFATELNPMIRCTSNTPGQTITLFTNLDNICATLRSFDRNAVLSIQDEATLESVILGRIKRKIYNANETLLFSSGREISFEASTSHAGPGLLTIDGDSTVLTCNVFHYQMDC